MSYWIRAWAATAGAVLALASAPAAIVTIASPAVSRADVCMAGQYEHAGVCVNILDDPAIYEPLPPPPPPQGSVCVTATGRQGHVTATGCT